MSKENTKKQKLTEMPEPPEELNEKGNWYWYTYADALISRGALYESILPTLKDLCWWESQKEQHRDKLAGQPAVHEYHNDDGNIKHSQASGWFTNLKAIQSKVDSLREDLGLTADKAKEEAPGKSNRRSKSEAATGWEERREKNF